jgi:hypothetical protein
MRLVDETSQHDVNNWLDGIISEQELLERIKKSKHGFYWEYSSHWFFHFTYLEQVNPKYYGKPDKNG